MTSYFDWLSLELQELILRELSSSEGYRLWKSGCVTRQTFQLFHFHVHQQECSRKALPVPSEQQADLDYLLIHHTLTYLRALAAIRAIEWSYSNVPYDLIYKAGHTEGASKDLIIEAREDLDPKVVTASELYLVSLIDHLPYKEFCHLLIEFEDTHSFISGKDKLEEPLARAIMSCKGLAELFIAKLSIVTKGILEIMSEIAQTYPLGSWVVEDLINLGAPFGAVLEFLLCQGNAYLIKIFLHKWRAMRGNSLEGLLNVPSIFTRGLEYPSVAAQTLHLILDLFQTPKGFLQVLELPYVKQCPQLMGRIIALPYLQNYEDTLSLVESLMGAENTEDVEDTYMGPLLQRLYDFFLADEGLKLENIGSETLCRLSVCYWDTRPIVGQLCGVVVAKYSHDPEVLKELLGNVMASGLFDLILPHLSFEEVQRIVSNICKRRNNVKAPTSRKTLGRILALRPEVYADFELDPESLKAKTWSSVVLKHELLRKQYGVRFVLKNRSCLKTVARALKYEDLCEELFPLLYERALTSYQQDLITLLEASKYHALYPVVPPEDY